MDKAVKGEWGRGAADRGGVGKKKRGVERAFECRAWSLGRRLVCHPVGNRPSREGCRLRRSASDVDGSLWDDKSGSPHGLDGSLQDDKSDTSRGLCGTT